MRLKALRLTPVLVLLVGCSGAPAASPTRVPATTTPIPPTATPTASPSPAPSPAPSPTPAARTVTSDDGLLTIEVPPGALPADVNLTATAQGQDDLPPELAGIQMRSGFYSLEPDGLTFAEPGKVTRRANVADLGWDLATDGIPLITLALRTSDGTWSWLDEQEIEVDGEDVVMTALATHTSALYGFGGTNFVQWGYGAPSPVDGSFNLDASVTYPSVASAWPVVGPPEPFTHTGILSSYDHRMYDYALPRFYQGFGCDTPGTGEFGVRFEVRNLGAGNPLWDQLDLPPPTTDIYLEALAICQAADAVPFELDSVCVRVFHDPFGLFVSYLEWFMAIAIGGQRPDYFMLPVEGANDGQPQQLRYDMQRNGFSGQLGLHEPGKKKILRFVAHLADGTTIDLTQQLIAALGSDEINVRFPQEDKVGTCPRDR